MSLFSSIGNWLDARYQKSLAEAEESGICPQCLGRGYNMYGTEHLYSISFYNAYHDCPACDGSGLFSDWQE